MTSTQTTTEKAAKTLDGVVVSAGNNKTVTVKVTRYVKHPKYKKFYKKSKNFTAHDENNTAVVGDKVQIAPSRPISKTKKFIVV